MFSALVWVHRAQAVEAMILFLAGSGVDVAAVRASIRLLEETQYLSPLAHPGQCSQQLVQQQSVTSKSDRLQQANSPRSTSPAEPMKRTTSQASRPPSPSEHDSQQQTPRQPVTKGESHQQLAATTSIGNLNDANRLQASNTNPFASD